jgi:hypothetical protein
MILVYWFSNLTRSLYEGDSNSSSLSLSFSSSLAFSSPLLSSSFCTFHSPLAIRHRCVEDDGGDGSGDSEEPIIRVATFFFSSSLSSSDEPLDDSMFVS